MPEVSGSRRTSRVFSLSGIFCDSHPRSRHAEVLSCEKTNFADDFIPRHVLIIAALRISLKNRFLLTNLNGNCNSEGNPCETIGLRSVLSLFKTICINSQPFRCLLRLPMFGVSSTVLFASFYFKHTWNSNINCASPNVFLKNFVFSDQSQLWMLQETHRLVTIIPFQPPSIEETPGKIKTLDLIKKQFPSATFHPSTLLGETRLPCSK